MAEISFEISYNRFRVTRHTVPNRVCLRNCAARLEDARRSSHAAGTACCVTGSQQDSNGLWCMAVARGKAAHLVLMPGNPECLVHGPNECLFSLQGAHET